MDRRCRKFIAVGWMKDLKSKPTVLLDIRQPKYIKLNVTRADVPGAYGGLDAGPGEVKGGGVLVQGTQAAARQEEVHPLLLLYPFDPPSVEPAAEAGRGISYDAEVALDQEPFELPEDISIEGVGRLSGERSGTSTLQPLPTAPRATRSRGKSHRSDEASSAGGILGFWQRYGVPLGFTLICNVGASYQVAGLYRLLLGVRTSTLALLPATALLLLLPVLSVIYLVRSSNHEILALSMIAVGGALALVGLVCKVLVIAAG